MRVLYHQTGNIADIDDVSGLMLSQSKILKLTVKPAVVRDAAAKRKAAEGLIAALPGEGKVLIVRRQYEEDEQKEVPLDSAQGKLLTMGIDAVPALLSAAQNEKNPTRRAYVFGLLYTATREHPPEVGDKALGFMKWWGTHWRTATAFFLGMMPRDAVIIDPKAHKRSWERSGRQAAGR